MAFFKQSRNRHLDEFDEEQRLYQAASDEFDDGESHPELRARVLSEANENREFAKTRFIEERVKVLLVEKNATPEAPDAGAEAMPLETRPEASPPTEESPVVAVVSRKDAKKVGGYFSLASCLGLFAIAVLYLSLGGIKTGVVFLLAGAATLALGLKLLKG